MRITVFGGARSKPGEPAYDEALKLGRLLAQAGFDVMTGGYGGAMEAVSRGATEAGVHVVGVTCVEIEKWRKTHVNAWVKEERRCQTLDERLRYLMENCDGAIALSGGAGTLTEISLLWNRLLIGSITPRPLIVVGQGWKMVFDQLFTNHDIFIAEQEKRWLTFVNTVEEAMIVLLNSFSHPR